MGRYEDMERLLGEQAVSKIRTSKVLLVGAGGIGCEVVKELVLAGFGEIHLIDLDTIDLSNLNRQFLFGQQHIKQPKATVAAEVAGEFNPNVHLVPYVANIITDARFTPKWFSSFDVAFNALDNAEARRHVNRMCVSTGVPLIDCGTAGFRGQVQVILPRGRSECYDCLSHPEPQTFAVCTIRSTPSQPIHCVVWAKSFLFSLLFGPDEEENVMDASIDNDDEDTKKELKELQGERNELIDLKRSTHEPDFVEKMVKKVFVTDIERLASIAVVNKPVPLKYDSIPASVPEQLNDQRPWSTEEALAVLRASAVALAERNVPTEFDKDDEDALNFVAAATMLRSTIFDIAQKSKFDIKQIAGNIIPAIATTNALVSGMGVVEALKVCTGDESDLRCTNIFRSSNYALLGEKLHPSDPNCPVSSVARTKVSAGPATKLQTLVVDLLQEKLGYGDVSLVTDSLLYDPDFDDNLTRTLADLKLDEHFITVIDDDDRRQNLELYVTTAAGDGQPPSIDDVVIPLKPDVKRSRDTNSDSENDQPAKRQELNGQTASAMPQENKSGNDNGEIDLTVEEDGYILL